MEKSSRIWRITLDDKAYYTTNLHEDKVSHNQTKTNALTRNLYKLIG